MAPRTGLTPRTPPNSNRRSWTKRLSGFFSSLSLFRNSALENESPNNSRPNSPQKISSGADEQQKKKDTIMALANHVMSFDGATELTEGVFRISADAAVRKKALENTLMTETTNEIPNMSANNAAAAIKAILLTLDPPLIPTTTQEALENLYKEQGPQSASYDAAKFRAEILATLSTIPVEDKDLLESVLNSALHVEANKAVTKMDPTNLGVVFGPNLFKHLEGDDLLASAALQNDLAQAIIEAKIEEKSRATETAVQEKRPAAARRVEVKEAKQRNRMPELFEEDEGFKASEPQPPLTGTLSDSHESLDSGAGLSLGGIPDISFDATPVAPAKEKLTTANRQMKVGRKLPAVKSSVMSEIQAQLLQEEKIAALQARANYADAQGLMQAWFDRADDTRTFAELIKDIRKETRHNITELRNPINGDTLFHEPLRRFLDHKELVSKDPEDKEGARAILSEEQARKIAKVVEIFSSKIASTASLIPSETKNAKNTQGESPADLMAKINSRSKRKLPKTPNARLKTNTSPEEVAIVVDDLAEPSREEIEAEKAGVAAINAADAELNPVYQTVKKGLRAPSATTTIVSDRVTPAKAPPLPARKYDLGVITALLQAARPKEIPALSREAIAAEHVAEAALNGSGYESMPKNTAASNGGEASNKELVLETIKKYKAAERFELLAADNKEVKPEGIKTTEEHERELFDNLDKLDKLKDLEAFFNALNDEDKDLVASLAKFNEAVPAAKAVIDLNDARIAALKALPKKEEVIESSEKEIGVAPPTLPEERKSSTGNASDGLAAESQEEQQEPEKKKGKGMLHAIAKRLPSSPFKPKATTLIELVKEAGEKYDKKHRGESR